MTRGLKRWQSQGVTDVHTDLGTRAEFNRQQTTNGRARQGITSAMLSAKESGVVITDFPALKVSVEEFITALLALSELTRERSRLGNFARWYGYGHHRWQRENHREVRLTLKIWRAIRAASRGDEELFLKVMPDTLPRERQRLFRNEMSKLKSKVRIDERRMAVGHAQHQRT